MTLPYDMARCQGVNIEGYWREGCEDCQRRTAPWREHWQTVIQPPAIIAFECENYIPPDEKSEKT